MWIPSRLRQKFSTKPYRSLVCLSLWLLVPLAIYTAILLIPFPIPVRPLSVAARYSFLTTLGGAGAVLFGLFSLRGWIGSLAALSGVLALFALGLFGLWASGQSTSTVFAGLLPLYDASNYYLDAQRLLAGDGFTQFSSWRPLFPGLLSLLLGLTGNHLQVTLAILGAIAAFSCFFFVVEVQRRDGAVTAVMTLLILLFLLPPASEWNDSF